MTIELALLLVGAALILAAALAGRARRPARVPRMAGAYTGALCVVAGILLFGGATGGAAAPIRTTVTAELAHDEVSEEIRVFLDGRDMGVVRVDERARKATLAVTVAGPGRRGYRLESTRQVKGKRPERASRESQVVVDGERPLGIVYSRAGDVYLTAL